MAKVAVLMADGFEEVEALGSRYLKTCRSGCRHCFY